MNNYLNIKQKIIKFINLLIIIVYCSACQTLGPQSTKQVATKPAITEIAVLVPLSGNQKSQGLECIDFIKGGISEYSDKKIHFSIYDAANKELALSALDKVIAKNTKIILGPLTSNVTEAIIPKLSKTDIITISLANRTTLKNKRLFLFGHQPTEQLLAVVNSCLNNEYQHFVLLLPNTSNFKDINNQIRKLLVSNGGMLVKTEFYNNTHESIDSKIKTISEALENLSTTIELKERVIIITFVNDNIVNNLKNSIIKYNLAAKIILAGNNKLDTSHTTIHTIFASSSNLLDNHIRLSSDDNIATMNNKQALAFDLGNMVGKILDTPFNKGNFLAKLSNNLNYNGITGKINFIDDIATRKYDIIYKVGNESKIISSIAKPKT